MKPAQTDQAIPGAAYVVMKYTAVKAPSRRPACTSRQPLWHPNSCNRRDACDAVVDDASAARRRRTRAPDGAVRRGHEPASQGEAQRASQSAGARSAARRCAGPSASRAASVPAAADGRAAPQCAARDARRTRTRPQALVKWRNDSRRERSRGGSFPRRPRSVPHAAGHAA